MKKIIEFLRSIEQPNAHISTKDPRLQADFYRYNLFFCMNAGIVISILSLIGMIGTSASLSEGAVYPDINAVSVYLSMLVINLLLVALLFLKFQKSEQDLAKKQSHLTDWFMIINMVLASFTFFTTQKNSSFFFEYILVTSVTCLLPNVYITTYFRNAAVNLLAVAIVFHLLDYSVSWQDFIDLIILHIICGFVNWVRYISFVHYEKVRFTLESKEENSYLKSRTDGLTGLLNRSALRDDFPGFCESTLGIALIDLDSFKKFNDTYGHTFGDRVLIHAGNCLGSIFRDGNEKCYRYGGDEFLVVVKNEDAQEFARKLGEFEKSCGLTNPESQNMIHFSASIGYDWGKVESEEDMRSLIRNADQYLYKAKKNGRGRIEGRTAAAGGRN